MKQFARILALFAALTTTAPIALASGCPCGTSCPCGADCDCPGCNH